MATAIEKKITAADTYGRNSNGESWGEWLEDQARSGTSLAGAPPANGWDRPTLLAAWRRGDQACNWRVPGGAKTWTSAQMG